MILLVLHCNTLSCLWLLLGHLTAAPTSFSWLVQLQPDQKKRTIDIKYDFFSLSLSFENGCVQNSDLKSRILPPMSRPRWAQLNKPSNKDAVYTLIYLTLLSQFDSFSCLRTPFSQPSAWTSCYMSSKLWRPRYLVSPLTLFQCWDKLGRAATSRGRNANAELLSLAARKTGRKRVVFPTLNKSLSACCNTKKKRLIRHIPETPALLRPNKQLSSERTHKQDCLEISELHRTLSGSCSLSTHSFSAKRKNYLYQP